MPGIISKKFIYLPPGDAENIRVKKGPQAFVKLLFGLTILTKINCIAYPYVQLQVPDGCLQNGTFSVSVLSPKQASDLIQIFKKNRKIPFDYGSDGCKERTQLMTSMAADLNIELGKVFVTGQLYADNSKSKLKSQMPNDVYDWKKHVAAIVYIKNGTKTELAVIDPSMSETPMTLDEFRKKLSRKGLDHFANGSQKPDPFINQLYFGSRFQFDSFEEYPAKIPPMSTTGFDRIAEYRLKYIDRSDIPGLDGDFVMSEKAYCEKYGECPGNQEKGRAIKKRLEDEFAAHVPTPQSSEREESARTLKTALIPDGYKLESTFQLPVISEIQAQQLFQKLQSSSIIRRHIVEYSSYNSHTIVEAAMKEKIELGQLFIEGILFVKSRRSKIDQPVRLVAYTTAFAVVKKTDGSVVKMILDPSLFDEPVDMAEIKKAVQATAIGSEEKPMIKNIYCGDRFQFQPFKDFPVKFPPHDMSQLYEKLIKPMYDQVK